LATWVSAGWDLFTATRIKAAAKSRVLVTKTSNKLKPFLSKINPMKAAFDKDT